MGDQESLLWVEKRRKLMWFGHMTRHDSLAKTITQGFVEGTGRRGRPRKGWIDNICDWTGCGLQDLLQRSRSVGQLLCLCVSSMIQEDFRRKDKGRLMLLYNGFIKMDISEFDTGTIHGLGIDVLNRLALIG